jgi:hypothetical protein
VEKICVECGRFFDPTGSSRVTCDDDCRAARLRARQTSIAARFTAHQRIIREEKIKWADDRLAFSENFYAALIESGCTYCGVSLLGFSGVCLDRIDGGLHNSWNVCACCPTCNRLKSDEFDFEEALVLGKAVTEIRRRRETAVNKKKKENK